MIRLAAFYLLSLSGAVLLAWVFHVVTGVTVGLAMQSLAALLAVVPALLWLGGRPVSLRRLGWPPWSRGASAFGAFLALGVAMAVGSALAITAGESSWIVDGSLGVHAGYVVRVFPLLLFAALVEELMFRGFPLDVLARGIGRIAAVTVLGVMFMSLHLSNPGVSFLGALNVGLASVMLSLAYFTSGAMAAAWGLHFGWNFGLAAVGVPVSGLVLGDAALSVEPGGPAWLSGEMFGPEGSLIGTMVFLIAIWVLFQRIEFRDAGTDDSRSITEER